jgi:hypothetical protein
MLAWKSLLFNHLASITSTAHICAHIPLYFGQLIASVLMLLFPCASIITSTNKTIKLYIVADFDVEIDTTISDHIVGASKCQNISDDKAEGKVRTALNNQGDLEKEVFRNPGG